MRRREFMVLVGGMAGGPFAAAAQQPTMPVVGFLRSTSFADATHLVTAFRQGLKEAGFVEGRNAELDYRYADNQLDRLPALVAELIRRPVALIAGNAVAMQAAKAATSTIPIVFTTGGDPIAQGLVASLNRPEANVTGVVYFANVLGPKRLELLRQLVPKAIIIGMIVNASNPNSETERRDVEAAAQVLGQQLIVLDANSSRDIDAALAMFIERGAGGLLVGSGAFMNSHRERLVALAARHALPAIYHVREASEAGGLMSYAPKQSDAYHQAGIYAGRILKGERPGDLPVTRSTKFELVLNLKTAKTLGLEIPATLLALADEVIE